MTSIKALTCFLVLPLLIFLLPIKAQADKKLTVYTVNYPLYYFAERIGGGHIDVVFPAPNDVDPAFWKPDPVTIKKYQQADLIILNGASYAKWTKKTSLPMLRTVDTSRSFKKDLVNIQSSVTHSHGPGGDHSHGGTAFTTWLDFSQAGQQAQAIYGALSRKKPTLKADFAKNLQALKQDLLKLDKQMLNLSSQKPNIALFGSHPIYQYMAKRYNLNLTMVMWEPEEFPSSAAWNHFQELLDKHNVGWMIWEGKPLVKSNQRLQGMGVQSLVFSPCFAKPEKGDFLSVMQKNIENIEKIFN